MRAGGRDVPNGTAPDEPAVRRKKFNRNTMMKTRLKTIHMRATAFQRQKRNIRRKDCSCEERVFAPVLTA